MLKIEYVPIGDLKPYENNAKIHTDEQIEQIKKSIQDYGFKDPVGVWKGEIVEGHGRVIAAKELGMSEIPIIRLDDLTDEQRREYALVHNQTTMNSGFDFAILDGELEGLPNLDAVFYGFETSVDSEEKENPYTSKVDIPQYKITGEQVSISELTDCDKRDELLEKINRANIDDEQKEFLRIAAHRHVFFNYKKIAEYYASTDEEMKSLMEEQALVIIDINDAIKNGYALLRNEISDIVMGEQYE